MASKDHLEQAADWFDRVEELDEHGKQELSLWLTVPEHQLAFTRIATAIGQPDVALAAIELAKQIGTEHGSNTPVAVTTPGRKRRFAGVWYGLAASAAIVMLIVGLGEVNEATKDMPLPVKKAQHNQELTLFTPNASPNSTVLKDGSVVYLSGNSSLEVNHTEILREVRLNKGQAYFDVAHSTERPFVVNVNETKIQVVGTAFDIDKLVHQTVIRVYEGVVRVFADKSLTVIKGEGVVLMDGNWHHTFRIDDKLLPEWRSGWLDVDNQPVDVVAEQLSRYLSKPVRVEGQTGKRIAGRFNLVDADKSLKLLAASDGFTLEERSDIFVLTVSD